MALILGLLAGCRQQPPVPPASTAASVAQPATTHPAPMPPTAEAIGPAHTVLVIGDSLSAAYGLSAQQGWVALLDQQLRQRTPAWQVINASISGDTTAGGRARLAGDLKRHRAAVVIIELGANDGLRGLPIAEMRANLAWMIEAAQKSGAKVLLIGMQMPPNLGPEYTRDFADTYAELAREYGTALLPFLLEPIATERGNFQDDNLHPVAQAQPVLRDHVLRALAPLLD